MLINPNKERNKIGELLQTRVAAWLAATALDLDFKNPILIRNLFQAY